KNNRLLPDSHFLGYFWLQYRGGMDKAFKLILGYSLESAFKGIICKRKGARKIHDLVSLAQEAKIPLGQKREHFLRNMSEEIVWRSRYYLPNNEKRELTSLEIKEEEKRPGS